MKSRLHPPQKTTFDTKPLFQIDMMSLKHFIKIFSGRQLWFLWISGQYAYLFKLLVGTCNILLFTRAPLRGRLTPPATLAQGKEECNKKHVKGTERRRPMIWCEQRFDNAKSCSCRASCPVVLSCAVCFWYRCYVLIGSTGVICVGEKTRDRERSNTYM